MQQLIAAKLTETFSPTHLEIINESKSHNVPQGSESHFKVVCVSSAFEGLSSLKRHRAVQAVLKDELAGGFQGGGIHALSITALPPSKWDLNPSVEESPQCLGGSKR
jgi:stress-induced morphogen